MGAYTSFFHMMNQYIYIYILLPHKLTWVDNLWSPQSSSFTSFIQHFLTYNDEGLKSFKQVIKSLNFGFVSSSPTKELVSIND